MKYSINFARNLGCKRDHLLMFPFQSVAVRETDQYPCAAAASAAPAPATAAAAVAAGPRTCSNATSAHCLPRSGSY